MKRLRRLSCNSALPSAIPSPEPGLHFRIPFIQEVRKFDKRLLSWDGDPNQVPTVEEQFISVDTTARWKIIDPLKFLQSVQDEAGGRNRLNDILDSVVRDKIASSPLVNIVRSKDWEVTEEDLQRTMTGEREEEILLQKVERDGRNGPGYSQNRSAADASVWYRIGRHPD